MFWTTRAKLTIFSIRRIPTEKWRRLSAPIANTVEVQHPNLHDQGQREHELLHQRRQTRKRRKKESVEETDGIAMMMMNRMILKTIMTTLVPTLWAIGGQPNEPERELQRAPRQSLVLHPKAAAIWSKTRKTTTRMHQTLATPCQVSLTLLPLMKSSSLPFPNMGTLWGT